MFIAAGIVILVIGLGLWLRSRAKRAKMTPEQLVVEGEDLARWGKEW